jgi:histidine triad (HIT) family protein
MIGQSITRDVASLLAFSAAGKDNQDMLELLSAKGMYLNVFTLNKVYRNMERLYPSVDTSSENCIFCQIARGQAASYVVFEDDLSLAFLDRRPVFFGHCLLIPKSHYETLPDLPVTLLEPFFANVQLLCRAVEQGLAAEGTFVAINNRVSQSVPHVHVHVIPRRRGDGLRGFLWPRQNYPNDEQIIQVQEAIRRAIVRLRS